jgi:hypothetical protein
MTTTHRARPTYRALSIRQPWAWAIVCGGKTVENRDWDGCAYRGPILIHASKGGTKRDFAAAVQSIAAMRAELGLPPLRVPERHELPHGCLVGAARIVGAERHPANFDGRPSKGFAIAGALGLQLADIEELDPLPCKGALGLFEVPDELLVLTPHERAMKRLTDRHNRLGCEPPVWRCWRCGVTRDRRDDLETHLAIGRLVCIAGASEAEEVRRGERPAFLSTPAAARVIEEVRRA